MNGPSEIFQLNRINEGKKGKQMNRDFQRETAILIVDDDEQIRRLIQRVVRKDGYACFLASDGEEALKTLEREKVDVVITDINMPKMDGIKLTERIKAQYDQDVIIMTGYSKDLTYARCHR